MQKLQFEEAWDKTISDEDRQLIVQQFERHPIKEGLHFSFLWTAMNYKNEQLVTVLIHNHTATPLTIQDTAIAYQNKQHRSMTNNFSIPQDIPPHTSMPWTFIFSDNQQVAGDTAQITLYESDGLK